MSSLQPSLPEHMIVTSVAEAASMYVCAAQAVLPLQLMVQASPARQMSVLSLQLSALRQL